VDLKKCIEDMEGVPKDRADLKGYFIKGMTALQAMVGDEMALKAMQTNERLTNKVYQEALDDFSLPDDVRTIVARNRADEARHLEWINLALSNRTWESTGTEAHL
jgi:demethoxyubiquinone hydroxylase (CLK1/Coq7/Cat5 family)